jgi:hypothetical protein
MADASTAKQATKALPGFHPYNEETYGSGRLTGYVGTITAAYYDAYRGKTKTAGDPYYPYLVIELADVVLADGEPHEPIVNRYLAGYLTSKFGPGTMPSEDGVTPVGATKEEYEALGNGSMSIEAGTEAQYRGRRTCGNKIKGLKEKEKDRPDAKAAPAWWAVQSVAEAPVDATGERWDGWTPEGWAYDLVGLRCLFDAIDKPGSSGLMLATRIVETPAAGAAKPVAVASAGKPAATTAAAANGNSELDDELANLLLTELAGAPNQTLTLQAAAQAALKAYASDAKKMRVAVPRVAAVDFHAGRPWTFVPGKHITLAG